LSGFHQRHGLEQSHSILQTIAKYSGLVKIKKIKAGETLKSGSREKAIWFFKKGA